MVAFPEGKVLKAHPAADDHFDRRGGGKEKYICGWKVSLNLTAGSTKSFTKGLL